MVRTRPAGDNPLEHLTPMKRDKAEERRRRALTEKEVTRLLSITPGEPERCGMSGMARALVYELAIESGLRYSEIKALTVADFDLKAQRVTIQTGHCKNRQAAELSLRTELVDQLKSYLAGKMPKAKAFAMPDISRASKMFKQGAEAAGI